MHACAELMENSIPSQLGKCALVSWWFDWRFGWLRPGIIYNFTLQSGPKGVVGEITYATTRLCEEVNIGENQGAK